MMQRKRRGDEEDDSEDENQFEQPQPPVTRSSVADTRFRYFIGKDYANSYEKDFEILEKFNEGKHPMARDSFDCIDISIDFVDRRKVPRMPWHDEALVVFGKAARDVARHFIQRWNIHKVCQRSHRFTSFISSFSV